MKLGDDQHFNFLLVMFDILWNGLVFGGTLRLLDLEKLNLHIFNVLQTLEYADTEIA